LNGGGKTVPASGSPDFGQTVTSQHPRSFTLVMLLLQVADKLDNLVFFTVEITVKRFTGLDNQVNETRKTAAATAALAHFMIHLNGDNQLPGILPEHVLDNRFDIGFCNYVAAANQHVTNNPDKPALLNLTKILRKKQSQRISFRIVQIWECWIS
jgi:hypothetical protein